MTKEIKFCFAHFPVGTIIEIGESLSKLGSFKEVTQFEVTGVIRNGANSYLLETTHYNEYETPVYDENFKPTGEMRTERLNTSLNITHVGRIIKRGSGPVKLCSSGHGFRPVAHSERLHKGRNSYAGFYGLETRVMQLVSELVPVTGCVDYEGLYQYLRTHASFKTHTEAIFDDHYSMYIGSTRLHIRKKKLKKAIRQNINRFLKSPKKVQKEWDSAVADDYERDWNDNFDREHKLGDYSCGEADLDYDDTYYNHDQCSVFEAHQKSILDDRFATGGIGDDIDVDEQDFLSDRTKIAQEETHL